jgi:hypothetical protein
MTPKVYDTLFVIAGLDPAIHPPRKADPTLAKKIDPRVKLAGDGRGWRRPSVDTMLGIETAHEQD